MFCNFYNFLDVKKGKIGKNFYFSQKAAQFDRMTRCIKEKENDPIRGAQPRKHPKAKKTV